MTAFGRTAHGEQREFLRGRRPETAAALGGDIAVPLGTARSSSFAGGANNAFSLSRDARRVGRGQLSGIGVGEPVAPRLHAPDLPANGR